MFDDQETHYPVPGETPWERLRYLATSTETIYPVPPYVCMKCRRVIIPRKWALILHDLAEFLGYFWLFGIWFWPSVGVAPAKSIALPSIALFLLYVNYATGGHWFLTFALPVTGAAGLLVCAMVTLLRYLPGAALYICGGALILSGGLAVLVEFLLNLTFGLHDTFLWSIYPLAVGVVLGAMLLVIAVSKPLRRSLHRKFFL